MKLFTGLTAIKEALTNLAVSLLGTAKTSISEHDGKTSSIRIVLFAAMYVTYDLIQFWKEIVLIEIQRETERDLVGVAAIGTSIIPILVTAVIGKVLNDKLKAKYKDAI